MARLFLGPREIAFVNDITKELISDVNDQNIFLYTISEKMTLAHDVYHESQHKAFNNPVKLACFVDAILQEDTKIDQFGIDSTYKVECYVQYKDLVDRGIEINVGDFFSFSDIFFEITQMKAIKNIWGQAEHKNGLVFVGTKARDDQFKALLHGPTDIKYTDEDAVQKKFVQERGESENSEGLTGDTRELREVLGKPITGPKEVSERGAVLDDSHYKSSFYGDSDDDQ